MSTNLKKANICVLSFENITVEYRVRNQINSLSKRFNVDFIGFGDWSPPDNVNYIQLRRSPKNFFFYLAYIPLLLIGKLFPSVYKQIFKLRKEYKQAKKIIQSKNYDIIHANDWDALPVSLDACNGKKTKVVFDAHEYSTEQQSELFLWRFLVKPFRQWLFRFYLNKADQLITVSDAIARLYEKEFSVGEVSVIYNTRFYIKSTFSVTNPELIKIIYHGRAIRSRVLEKIILLSDYLDDRFMINLMLIPYDQSYYQLLKRRCENICRKNVEVVGFVDYSQINDELLQYDIGIPAIHASNFNNLYALGGKFFDYIMAGLAIAVPSFTAYKNLVEKYQIGIVSKDMNIESLASELNRISARQIDDFKKKSLKTARQLDFEHEEFKLFKIYDGLLQQ